MHKIVHAAVLLAGCASEETVPAETAAQHFVGTMEGRAGVVVGMVVHDGALGFYVLDNVLIDPFFAWAPAYDLDTSGAETVFDSADHGRWLVDGTISHEAATGAFTDALESVTFAWSAELGNAQAKPGFISPGVYSDESPCPTILLVLTETLEDGEPSQTAQGSYCADVEAGVSREQLLIVRPGEDAHEVWVTGEHTVDVLLRRKTRAE